MRWLLHLRRVVLALGVLCSAASLRAQDVFVRVPVELGGTAARVTFPFGEPFLLVGTAPEQLKAVNARYVTFVADPPSKERCDQLLADTTKATASLVRPWTRNPGVKSDSFAVLVARGLEANRRYGFCMQTRATLDSLALSGFQGRAYAILDSAYRALDHPVDGPPQNFPAPHIGALQRRLARALPQDQGEIDTRKTIFDTAGVKVTEQSLVFTTEVLQWQRGRFNAAKNLTNDRNLARNRLTGLKGDPALRAIAGTISSRDRVPGMDSSTVERVAATARMLAFSDPDLLYAVAGGEAVLRPAATLSTLPQEPRDVKDPAEIAARAARIDSTYARLSELRDFSAALEASRVLRRRTGLGPTQAAALRASLDAVRQTFQQFRESSAQWAHADASRNAHLRRAARSLRVTASDHVPVVATTISSFETRARQYVTADLGLAYAPGLGEVVPYFGANFYLGALNKRVPLALDPPNELDRWSVTVGVTASSLAQKDVRDDLFGSYSVLVGAGRRMTDPIRLTGGAILYQGRDVNPLLDRTALALSPFLSLSFDFDARSALGRVGDTLFQ